MIVVHTDLLDLVRFLKKSILCADIFCQVGVGVILILTQWMDTRSLLMGVVNTDPSLWVTCLSCKLVLNQSVLTQQLLSSQLVQWHHQRTEQELRYMYVQQQIFA